MKKLILSALVILFAVAKSFAQDTLVTVMYSCPMHPEMVFDSSGKCPACGMQLEKVTVRSVVKKPEYTCPMHPEIKSDTPGRCPKCSMDLIRKKDE